MRKHCRNRHPHQHADETVEGTSHILVRSMRWRYKDTVLALCTLAFFATMVARLAISPVVPDIVADFDVSNTVIGIALTGLWMSYFLAQFPSGVLADRFGERSIILVAVGGTAVSSVLIALSPFFGLFVLSTILLGLTAGLHYSVATALLSRTYDDIGTAIGLHSFGGPLAGLIAPVMVAWIAVAYGWRPAVAVGAAVAVPVFIVFAWRVRPTEPRRPAQPMTDQFELSAVRELLGRPPITFTVALAVACEFVWQATASFLPAFLIGHHGLSTTLAATLFGTYFIVHGVVQIGVGRVSDRFGRDPATVGCMLFGLAGYSTLVLAASLPVLIVGILLTAVGMSWVSAVLPRFIDHLSVAERGSGFGLVRTVYGMLGAMGSVGVGFFADVFDWGVSFGLLLVPLTFVLCALVANYVFEWGY